MLTREERFEDIMWERGITQGELAKQAGITPSILTNFKHDRPIQTDNLEAICKALSVTADYLLGLENVSSREPDMQAAQKLTGLSEKALTILQQLSKNPIFLTGLEHILTADPVRLSTLTAQVFRYMTAVAYLAKSKEDVDITVPLKDGHDVLSLSDSAKYRRQLAVETFRDMIRIEE